MRKGLIAASAAIALAMSLPTAPAKADGWAIAAGIAGGLILTGLVVNSAYGYPNYPYYGPRYGYAYYGGYNGGWGGPAYPAWRPYTWSYRAPYDYGYGYASSGYSSYGYGGYYGGGYPAYALATNYGSNCYWTKQPGPYGWRAARVCY